jgi:hypothetical protein
MGGDPSFSWTRPSPLPRTEAIGGLHGLKDACTPTQLKLRNEAFEKAEQFINAGPVDGAPVVRTFRNRNLPRAHKDARVDVEVLLGTAFV